MSTPSRYSGILTGDEWDVAFGRKDNVHIVIEFIQSHWSDLLAHPVPDLDPKESEPKITKFFALSLRKNARTFGITGYFAIEDPVAVINDMKLESKGRTDITYVSDRLEPPLNVVLEFKKLKSKPGANTSRLEYFKNGVLRFVNGIYGRDADIGFMVGLIASKADKPEILSGLQHGIQNPDMQKTLKMIKDGSGKTVVVPGAKFTTCHFETAHGRDHVPGCKDVLLGHFMLCHGP
ncbi:hypothetical protein [Methylobacillus sp.]|uniref:hypothetical protein n=1 Tax=Methylobacillus sp. TaxID=56818 RepID=UPI002FE05739